MKFRLLFSLLFVYAAAFAQTAEDYLNRLNTATSGLFGVGVPSAPAA